MAMFFSNVTTQELLPAYEPKSFLINEFDKMGIVGWYDLKRDKGNKVFNLMNRSQDFTNLLLSPEMNTGGGTGSVDGEVVANFIGFISVGNSATFSIDSAQKIELTNTVDLNGAVATQAVNVTPGEVISIGASIKTSGNIYAKIYCSWYNGGSLISVASSSNIQSADFAPFTNINMIAPAKTTTARFSCKVIPVTKGNVGSAWFKNARFVKAATLNCTGNTNAIVSGATPHPLGKSFDGVDDYASINNDGVLDFRTAFTIGAFENIISAKSHHLIAKNNNDLASQQYGIYHNATTSKFGIVVNGVAVYHSNLACELNKWYFVVATWDGSKIRLYINGKEDTISGYDFSTPLYSAPNIFIGKRGGGDTGRCIIGDVLLTNKALTAAQVKQVHNRLAWQYPGLAISA